MEEKVFEIVSADPGVKFSTIVARAGVMPKDDRTIDRVLQKLRRNGRLKYVGGGWHRVMAGAAS